MRRLCPVPITRLPHRIEPDPSRVIPRFFAADELKARRRIVRVLKLGQEDVDQILEDLRIDYGDQHRDIESIWRDHFGRAGTAKPSANRQCAPGVGIAYRGGLPLEGPAHGKDPAATRRVRSGGAVYPHRPDIRNPRSGAARSGATAGGSDRLGNGKRLVKMPG